MDFDDLPCHDHAATLKQMTSVLNALAVGQAKMQGTIDLVSQRLESGVKSITDRQDVTNGRINMLEPAVHQLEVDVASHDSFVPGFARDLEKFEAEVSARFQHEVALKIVDLKNEIRELQSAERNINTTLTDSKGFVRGATTTARLFWAIGGAAAGAGLIVIGWFVGLWAARQPTP